MIADENLEVSWISLSVCVSCIVQYKFVIIWLEHTQKNLHWHQLPSCETVYGPPYTTH